jgi:hypothetical protein
MTAFRIVMGFGVAMQNLIIVILVIMIQIMIVLRIVMGFGVETPDMILVASVKGWENWSTIWMMMVTDMATVK